MIASAARFSERIEYPGYLDFDVFTSSPAVRAA
jgi:hypothetical protein